MGFIASTLVPSVHNDVFAYRKIEDIFPGDFVFSPAGAPLFVKDAKERLTGDCVNLVFNGGFTIKCTNGQVWDSCRAFIPGPVFELMAAFALFKWRQSYCSQKRLCRLGKVSPMESDYELDAGLMENKSFFRFCGLTANSVEAVVEDIYLEQFPAPEKFVDLYLYGGDRFQLAGRIVACPEII